MLCALLMGAADYSKPLNNEPPLTLRTISSGPETLPTPSVWSNKSDTYETKEGDGPSNSASGRLSWKPEIRREHSWFLPTSCRTRCVCVSSLP